MRRKTSRMKRSKGSCCTRRRRRRRKSTTFHSGGRPYTDAPQLRMLRGARQGTGLSTAGSGSGMIGLGGRIGLRGRIGLAGGIGLGGRLALGGKIGLGDEPALCGERPTFCQGMPQSRLRWHASVEAASWPQLRLLQMALAVFPAVAGAVDNSFLVVVRKNVLRATLSRAPVNTFAIERRVPPGKTSR